MALQFALQELHVNRLVVDNEDTGLFFLAQGSLVWGIRGVLQHFLFVDDCGAAEEVVSGLAAFIEAQGDEVGDQEDGEEVEEKKCFHPGPDNSGEEGSGAKGNGANGAQTEGALAEGGTFEEAFTDGKVNPGDDDLDAVGVVECIEEGGVHGGQRLPVGEAVGEGFEPSGVFGHGSGWASGQIILRMIKLDTRKRMTASIRKATIRRESRAGGMEPSFRKMESSTLRGLEDLGGFSDPDVLCSVMRFGQRGKPCRYFSSAWRRSWGRLRRVRV